MVELVLFVGSSEMRGLLAPSDQIESLSLIEKPLNREVSNYFSVHLCNPLSHPFIQRSEVHAHSEIQFRLTFKDAIHFPGNIEAKEISQ